MGYERVNSNQKFQKFWCFGRMSKLSHALGILNKSRMREVRLDCVQNFSCFRRKRIQLMIILCNIHYETIIMLVNEPLVQLYMWEEVLVCFCKLISVLFQLAISRLFLLMFGFHCSLLGSFWFWTDFQVISSLRSGNFFFKVLFNFL